MKKHTSQTSVLVLSFAIMFGFGTEAQAMGIPFPKQETPTPQPTPPPTTPAPSMTPTPTPTPRPSATPVPTPRPTATPQPTPPQANHVAPLWEAAKADGKEWTAHVLNKLDTLGADIFKKDPTDFATFCPKYTQLSYAQKKDFWTYLISAMAKRESGFNTNSKYTEDFKDQNGNYVVSRGLLQISIESAKGYDCELRTAQDLHDPYVNLSCTIRILNRWVGRDVRIAGKVNGGWKGGARYWSVLRTTSGSYSTIVSLAKALPICK